MVAVHIVHHFDVGSAGSGFGGRPKVSTSFDDLSVPSEPCTLHSDCQVSYPRWDQDVLMDSLSSGEYKSDWVEVAGRMVGAITTVNVTRLKMRIRCSDFTRRALLKLGLHR